MLFVEDAPKENLVVRGARVLDPAEGVDAVLDVRIDDGTIAELGSCCAANGHRVLDGGGLLLAPAFVDPHVHLRTPGREDEETIATGTQAAAAGGYCAILAMPNTEPVVDSAAVLGALVETAREEAEVPVGFLAAITKGQAGRRADRDGRARRRRRRRLHRRRAPGRRAGLMRRALQYSAITGRPARAPLRGADALRGGPDARGRGLRRARLRRLPVGRRERDGRARPGARRVRGPAAAPPAPLGARVGRRGPRGARRRRRRGTAEVTPHHSS